MDMNHSFTHSKVCDLMYCINYEPQFLLLQIAENFYSSDLIFSPTNNSNISLNINTKLKEKMNMWYQNQSWNGKTKWTLYIKGSLHRRYSENPTFSFTPENSTHLINFFPSSKVNYRCSGNALERKMIKGAMPASWCTLKFLYFLHLFPLNPVLQTLLFGI